MQSLVLDNEGQSKSIQKNNLSYDTMYRCYTFDMMTSSNGNIFRVTGPLSGESSGHQCIPFTQRLVARSSDIVFDLRLNKRLSKQSRRRWFDTVSCWLWRHFKKRIADLCRSIQISGIYTEQYL